MKHLTVILRTSLIIALSAAFAVVSYGQNRERFGISAKAGGINSVIGRVLVQRGGQSSQQDLSAKDDLTSGDVVTTKGGSRVEVLLNPGSYLRVTEKSEFELTDNSLNNLQLKLVKGSAIVEATGTDALRLQIGILTEQSRFTIVRRGVYRINVLPGSTELLVQKGRVLVEGQQAMIKGGTKVTFNKGSSFTAKLTKKDRDEFDDWSKERGEFLARANERLSIRTLNSYLFDSGWDSAFYSSSRFGVWTYSPFVGGFTFFPFRYGWSSPYGHHYGRCGWLGYGFGGPVIVGYPSGGSYGGSGSSGGSSGGWGSGGSTGGSGGSTGGGSGSVGTPTRVAPSQPSQAGPAAPDPGGRPRTRDPL